MKDQAQRRITLIGLTATLMVGLWTTAGCNTHAVTPFDAQLSAEQTDIISAVEVPKVDVLWVVDNSGSMCEEQQSLRENFDRFVEVMVANRFDFQLAVVTTDMGDPAHAGRFQNLANDAQSPTCTVSVDVDDCPTAADAPPLIINSADPRYQDSQGMPDIATIQRDFGCRATVGIGGAQAGFEMGLEAARTALSPTMLSSTNGGFLRDDALLAVFFLTDENDCSTPDGRPLDHGDECEWHPERLVPVDDYIDFFSRLKTDEAGNPQPERVIMAGIIAPDSGIRYEIGEQLQPSCRPPALVNPNNPGEGAFSGYRYQAVLGAFEHHATANICQPPFDRALRELADLIPDAAQTCLSAPPSFCESDADCGQSTCEARGEVKVCASTRVQVEVERDQTEGEMVGRQCNAVNDRLRCVLVEGEDYVVDYDAGSCASGVGIDLIRERNPSDDILVRYPTTLQ